MQASQFSVADRAIAAADKAYRSAMAPRDGDDPTECMWQAVFAARDVYEAEMARLRDWLDYINETTGDDNVQAAVQLAFAGEVVEWEQP